MHKLEVQLTPNGAAALNLIRALRSLPEASGVIGAERSALNTLRIPDIKIIAIILRDEYEDVSRG